MESDKQNGEEGGKPGHDDGDNGKKREYFEIFVDDVRHEVQQEQLTGAQIKALAGKPAAYQLFLERPGHPDQLIDDAQTVTIKSGEHFHTIPPAQFG